MFEITTDSELVTEYLWLSIWLSLVLVLLLMSFRIVPQGAHYTVECCGWHLRTLKPGLHLVFPFIEHIAKRVSVKQEFIQLPTQQMTTQDGQLVSLTGMVAFQITNASYAAYKVNNVAATLLNLAVVSMRVTASQIDFKAWETERDHYNQLLKQRIAGFAKDWGIEILWVESEQVPCTLFLNNNGVNSANGR